MVPQKIIGIVGEADFAHEFFGSFSDDELISVKRNIHKGVSLPVTFLNEKKEVLFFAVVDTEDFYKDGLHVNILAGNFLRHYKFLAVFFEGMAQFLKKSQVTFCTKRKAIFKLGSKMGYRENRFGDLEKKVNYVH